MLGVDATGVELGDQLDVLAMEQIAESARGHRLGEGAVERRYVRQVDLVPNALLSEEPVGQEAELQRSDWTLDGHVDDIDRDAAALECGEGTGQLPRTVEGVEGE